MLSYDITKKKFYIFFFLYIIFIFIISYIILKFLEPLILIVFLIICSSIFFLFFSIILYKKTNNHISNLERKIISLGGEIYVNQLSFTFPIYFGDWSIDGDLARIMVKDIIENRRNFILELGSGSSTIIIAQLLKKLGKGKFYSIEDNENFYNKIKRELSLNGLEYNVNLILSPLKQIIVDNKEFLWYDTNFIKEIEKVDFLFVDGPPAYIQEMSRFPALPLLINKLNNDFVILLDDGKRIDEKIAVDKWKKLFPDFKYQLIDTIKGAWKISK